MNGPALHVLASSLDRPPVELQATPENKRGPYLVAALLLLSLLAGCAPNPPPTRSLGEVCVRACYPLPLDGINPTWGSCICGRGPVCADGRRP